MKSGKSRFPAHLVLETSWSLNISESRADDSVDGVKVMMMVMVMMMMMVAIMCMVAVAQ